MPILQTAQGEKNSSVPVRGRHNRVGSITPRERSRAHPDTAPVFFDPSVSINLYSSVKYTMQRTNEQTNKRTNAL